MLTGQAEITIYKANGQVVKQVIKNNIADEVFQQLQGQIRLKTDLYNSSTYSPIKIRVTNDDGGVYDTPSTNFKIDKKHNTPGSTKYLIEYSMKDSQNGNAFIKGGAANPDQYIYKVELLGGSDTVLATANSGVPDGQTTNNTFIAGSDTGSSATIDSNDLFKVTYKLQIQSFSDSTLAYVVRLLNTINGDTDQDITMHTYELLAANDGLISELTNKAGEGALNTGYPVVSNDGSNPTVAFGLYGAAPFSNVGDSPRYIQVKTSDGVVIMKADLHEPIQVNASDGVSATNETKLTAPSFVLGDNVTAEFKFNLNRLTNTSSMA